MKNYILTKVLTVSFQSCSQGDFGLDRLLNKHQVFTKCGDTVVLISSRIASFAWLGLACAKAIKAGWAPVTCV